MNKESVFSILNSLCNKYDFKLKDVTKNDNFYYEVYAKNTDGEEVVWFDIQVASSESSEQRTFEPILTVYGNTDQNNIWLCQTREDLTLKDAIYFCQQISQICNCKLVAHSTNNEHEMNIHHLIDLEDLQEFKDFTSLEDLEKLVKLTLDSDLRIADVRFYFDDYDIHLGIFKGAGCINYYENLEQFEANDSIDDNEFLFDYDIGFQMFYNVNSIGDKENDEIESLVLSNKKEFVKEFQEILLYTLDDMTKQDKINVFDMYKNLPNNYKNNLEKLYILDGIYTVSPDICKEDAELIYSVCEQLENENVNPFSVSHYLADHFTRGNITKEELEDANKGDIAGAAFYDNLNYFKPISDEKEIEI